LLGGVLDEKIVNVIRQVREEKVSVDYEELNEYLSILAYALDPYVFVRYIGQVSLIGLMQFD
jgi:hypothetical protein